MLVGLNQGWPMLKCLFSSNPKIGCDVPYGWIEAHPNRACVEWRLMLVTCSLLFNLGNMLGNIFENFETQLKN